MKVLVGSENLVKIQSVKEGFLTFFEHVEVEGISVDTGVPHQLFSSFLMAHFNLSPIPSIRLAQDRDVPSYFR